MWFSSRYRLMAVAITFDLLRLVLDAVIRASRSMTIRIG